MNTSRFDLFMTSVDDSLLEEALQPHNLKLRRGRIILRIAACLCLLIGGSLLLGPYLRTTNRDRIVAEDLLALEYNLPSLEGHAYDITYNLYDSEENAPLAEAILISGSDTQYIVRSLKTDTATDISGMVTDETPLIWAYGPLEFELCSNASASWLSWYSNDLQLQYCIQTAEDSSLLLQTAAEIVSILGYDMAVAPEDAVDIKYRVFLSDGLTIAETSFLYEDISYSFRMASTMEVSTPFADISGTGNDYNTHYSVEVLWCPAELYINKSAAGSFLDPATSPTKPTVGGKIIWFDVVPGLLYSLTCEDNISEESLLSMAETLFRPAQEGD